MQRNEAETIALVRADFRRIRAQCEQNGGEVLNTMGDGMMMCFPSSVQAVSCALTLQSEFGARRTSVPEEQALEHRIGIHLGDVIRLETGNVAGDGVNIAARLETNAPPGGICLSQMVYETVKGKVPMEARFVGPLTLKNIAEPIPAWQVMPEGMGNLMAPPALQKRIGVRPVRSVRWIAAAVSVVLCIAIAGGWYALRPDGSANRSADAPGGAAAGNKSIAVLPFTNMSEDKDTAYFADGVHEDLLTQLALLGDLKVVSRTSVMEYRNSAKNMRQIGAELRVGSLVEGSVRRAGNQVRVTAQLIDAQSDKHLWAKNYDRELKDIFAIQSELATEIARALKVTLAPQEQTRLARKPTENLEAYDLWIRHQDLVHRTAGSVRTMSSIKDRIELLSQAVELDPKFGLAWARLAGEHARAYGFGIDRSPSRQSQARDAMDRALTLAPDDPQVKIEQALYYSLALSDYARAAKAYEDILAIAPHNVEALNGLADVRSRQMRFGEQVALLERSVAIDGRNPTTLIRISNLYRNFRQFERAQALRRQLIEIRPDDVDLRANYYLNEYWRSGSWDGYDKWRASLASGVELQSARVRNTDTDRAIARRDFGEVLRLIDVNSDDIKALATPQDEAGRDVFKGLALLAKGDKSRALEYARAALQKIEVRLKQPSADDDAWSYKAMAHAMLGERKPALVAHEQGVAWARNVSPFLAELATRRLAHVYALLGDSREAVAELKRQVKLPAMLVHDIRVHLAFASLWENPQFKALVDDPVSNAPIPFNAQDAQGAQK
jgi:TolB-like protein